MVSESEFRPLVAQAYEHLYDLVYLRCHPLADLLVGTAAADRKERAWRLHHLLLEVIDELDPGPRAPAASPEVRRHQLMMLHYADGLDPQTVADRLAISRRHFYREHEAALDAVAQILWQRYQEVATRTIAAEASITQADRGELLRQEVARLARADRFAHLHEVLPGVLTLLGARLCQHNLTVETQIAPTIPPIGLEHNLLRQLLLAALSALVERCTDAMLALSAEVDATHVTVRLAVVPIPSGAQPDGRTASSISWHNGLVPVAELAELAQAQADLLGPADAPTGIRLRLPRAPQRTVLVVDDNQDALEFFHRILPYHGYRVVTARNGSEALQQARSVSPDVIMLDVMMPGEDGWDVLQTLRNWPETQTIPIIICSVLRASELALSLGANAFLAKPLTQEALLNVLQQY